MSRRPSHATRRLRAALVTTVALLALGSLAIAAVDAGLHHVMRASRTRPPTGGQAYVTRAGTAPKPSFSVHATPVLRRVAPGQSTRFTLSIFQRKYRGSVALRIISRLPSGLLATLEPSQTRGKRSVLRIATTSATAPRTSTIAIRATRVPPVIGAHRAFATLGRRHMTVRVRVVVRRPAPPVTSHLLVSGTVTGSLAPGASRPIDVHVANPFGFDLSVTAVSAAIAKLDAPRADAAHPCTTQDFAVRAYSGPALRVAKGALLSLSESAVTPAAWPQLVMLDRPVNQDGCKSARLTLTFRATARRTR